MRHVSVSKEATKVLIELLGDNPKWDIDDFAREVQPHFTFVGYEEAYNRELKRVATRLIARKRNEDGDRKYYINNGSAINIEKTDSVEDLSEIESKLHKNYIGNGKAWDKVKKRKNEVKPKVFLKSKEAK